MVRPGGLTLLIFFGKGRRDGSQVAMCLGLGIGAIGLIIGAVP